MGPEWLESSDFQQKFTNNNGQFIISHNLYKICMIDTENNIYRVYNAYNKQGKTKSTYYK